MINHGHGRLVDLQYTNDLNYALAHHKPAYHLDYVTPLPSTLLLIPVLSLSRQDRFTHPRRLKRHIPVSRFGYHHRNRNTFWPPLHCWSNLRRLRFALKMYQFLTKLLFNEPFKLAVNLTSLRKDCWNEH